MFFLLFLMVLFSLPGCKKNKIVDDRIEVGETNFEQKEVSMEEIMQEEEGSVDLKSDINEEFSKQIGKTKFFFATSKYDLAEEDKKYLQKIADYLNVNNCVLIIEGNCDKRGSDAVNIPLSEKRAKAIYDNLIGQGISSLKLQAAGFGSRILVEGMDDQALSQNRVALIYIKN